MKGVLAAVLITFCLVLVMSYSADTQSRLLLGGKNGKITGNLVLGFAGLKGISKEWTCFNGLTCQSKCEDTKYQRLWEGSSETKEYEYMFNAPQADRYACTFRIRTCCYNRGETNEVTDIYINGKKVGSTPDECCPEVCGLSAPSRLYALPKGSGKVHLSWRMVSTHPNLGYNIYRSTAPGGPYIKLNSNPVTGQTNYMDTGVTNGKTYYYVVRLVDQNGNESANSNEAKVVAGSSDEDVYVKFTNVKPHESENIDADIQAGDVDGDGLFEYLIITNFTAGGKNNNYITMYDDDGTKLWGPVNTGLRYSGDLPWTLWDLDEDGREEVIGPMYDEAGGDRLYLVAIDGISGNVIKQSDDIPHQYPQSTSGRNNRIYITPASLDGKNPYIIMQLGAYPNSNDAWTIAFDRNLNRVWMYYKEKGKHEGGSHMIVAADLDMDGKDEVLSWGICFDGNGNIRWQRTIGHHDLVYPADVDPDVPGMEVLYAIEQGFWSDPATGAVLVDKDGKVLWYSEEFSSAGAGGWAANVRSEKGLECYVKYDTNEGWKHRLYSAKGGILGSTGFGSTPYDWNGDGTADFYKPKEVAGRWSHIHADIIGDYREELIAYNAENGKLYVYTNNNMNPNGEKPSPWENHQYALNHRVGTYYRND